MMQTETEPKTKKTDTARTLADRERETAKARTALATAKAQEIVADNAYQEAPTSANRDAWDEASSRRERAARDVHAAEGREKRAREAHEAAIASARRAELDAIMRDTDADAFVTAIAADLVPAVLEIDRAMHERMTRIRAAVRARRAAIARAEEIGKQIGVDVHIRDVRLDDLRVVCGVAIARDRVAADRTTSRSEHFVTPIESAYCRGPLGTEANPLASPEAFDVATRILDDLTTKR